MKRSKVGSGCATLKKGGEGPPHLTPFLFTSVFHKMAMFLPHTKKFFDLFEDLADKAVEASQLLLELSADSPSAVPISLSPDLRSSNLMRIRSQLRTLENEADSIVHQIIHELFFDHTRVTEEKGDIRYFAHNLDNVIDNVEKAVARLAFTPRLTIPESVSEFAPVIHEAAQEIKKAVGCLRELRREEMTLQNCCIRINELENKADKINRRWLKILMTTPVEDPNEVLERLLLKEVVGILENTMDNCEDIANILETFGLKGGI
ncbi:MAG: DUF47 family protein [Methanophagales archaeon ANME-1-THS]|nr:MAG: DUF47 family protein [Methanophagales archaeon ANME-1-THS]